MPVKVKSAGIDTWSCGWYLEEDSSAARAAAALITVPAPRGKLLDHPVVGHRIGYMPASRLLWAEGHPNPLGLGSADRLPEVESSIEDGLADLGLNVPRHRAKFEDGPTTPRRGGRSGIRRIDATVDLEFDYPAEGWAVLGGVYALLQAGGKSSLWREKGKPQTVYLHPSSGSKILGRWYDKGAESGIGSLRGRWIRPEDQRRYPKALRPATDLADSRFVRERFVQRFRPLWKASEGVTVGDLQVLAAKLRRLLDEGKLTPQQAKAIGGHLVLDSVGAHRQSRTTVYRDRKLASDNGLVLAGPGLDEVEVDLGDVLEAALDADAWGAQG